jgi:hypothetical protein
VRGIINDAPASEASKALPKSGPASSNALLDGAKDFFSQARRDAQRNEEALRKEIVLSRFIDNSELPEFIGVFVA